MKKLIEDITNIVPTLEGWCSVEKACTLASLIVALRPTITVEVGVFGGRSFIPMAMAHKAMNRGTIHGIDPWSKEASAVGMTDEHLKWWSELDHEAIYSGFMTKLNALGLNECAEIVRTRSNEVPVHKFPFIDLLHLDGNHCDEVSCDDIRRFAPLVREGGILVMDDVEWAVKATELIASYSFDQLYRVEKWAVYQRSNLPKVETCTQIEDL